ncbi:hypothetical protein [Caminibacter mediatlanticus]|uniref:Uncharacterized protein n=1 Tax=Caminibacter mediatlanticus TB-2 TaxID=391592 RepID=A0AAI9AHK7_9BACT|nr:hypothetical protein [Caminibacter mediatlanticus]EDM23813.1 hypothetical protein CMTB2_01059 [Caminibacter mediatlanticus TB-2]
MVEMKNANFKIDKSKWEAFKKIAKMKHSDSSKELRKLIEKYIEENRDLLNKLF